MVMRVVRVAALVGFCGLAGGCVGPGVIRDLPDPVFPAALAQPSSPIAVAPPVLPAPREPAPRRMGSVTVIVDAGHGGDDPGAHGVAPVPEKRINLAIALELAHALEERGANVITTRESDRFIPLDDRAALADRTHTDLFVSIHADSSPRAEVSGATVYIARSASAASRDAAENIVAALERAGVECRGISQADFRVLARHSRPAVLVECGYLTNRAEAERLSTTSYQARLAAAIAEGITEHFSR
ncbi:MAG: N-acetylmuramoyl-L-alanine amidase [Planctomycetota bacterium]